MTWCPPLAAEIYIVLGAQLWLQKYIKDLVPTSG